MCKIIILIGLPGSGKSCYGDSLAVNEGTIHIDDVSMNGGLETIERAIEQGWETIVVSDVYLCFSLERHKAAEHLKNHEVEWIYFANDHEKCIHNVKRRATAGDCRKVENFIHLVTKYYTIPENAIVKPVWEPNANESRL